MAYLKVRPDKLDDTQAQLAGDHLIGASPRGWEDISNVLKSGLSDSAKRVFVQGRIGAANAAEFFGVLREIQAGADVMRLLAARPGAGDRGAAAEDARWAVRHDLRPARRLHRRRRRWRARWRSSSNCPTSRAPRRCRSARPRRWRWSCLMQRALAGGLEAAILDSPSYHRYDDRAASGSRACLKPTRCMSIAARGRSSAWWNSRPPPAGWRCGCSIGTCRRMRTRRR